MDFFVGDAADGHLESFQKLDPEGRLDETKFLVGVTDAERETIYRLYGREIWHRKVYDDMDALLRELPKFAPQHKDRYKEAAEDDLYAVLTKEAGPMDWLRRAGTAVRGALGGHTPAMLPLQNARPHAEIVHRPPPPAERPAIVPPYRADFPTIPPTGPVSSPHVPRTTPVGPPPGVRPSAPRVSTPPRDLPAPSPFDYTPVNHAVDTSGLKPTGRTPVERNSMPDMLMQAPGAPSAMKDLRVRAALGVRPTPGGGLAVRKPGTTSAMVAHLMRQHPGAEVTPELILQSMKSPEYAATRAQYKGASAKVAALARYGFKLAATKKRADIDKRISGEILVAGGPTAGEALARITGPVTEPGGYNDTKTAGVGDWFTPDGYRRRERDEVPLSSKLLQGAGGALMLGSAGVMAHDLLRGGSASNRAAMLALGLQVPAMGLMAAGAPGFYEKLPEKTAAPRFLYDVAPSLGAAMDAFDAESKRQAFIEAQKDAIRFPASHYTQPTMMQFATGGGDIASTPAPTHHHRRHHHG